MYVSLLARTSLSTSNLSVAVRYRALGGEVVVTQSVLSLVQRKASIRAQRRARTQHKSPFPGQ